MKTNEEMKGTNRIAVMLDYGGKIYVDKKCVDRKDQYIVSTNYLDLSQADITEFDTLTLENMEFNEDGIRVTLLILKNVALRTIYFNNDGFIDEYIGSYSPLKEEKVMSKPIAFNLTEIKQISADLELFKELLENGIITGSVDELSKYGLYYPKLKVIK